MHQLIDQITNSNGGGLSHAVTGKYTSVRHEKAKLSGKLTAGEAAAYLTKILKIKIFAADVRPHLTEWHHSGFYKSGNKSVMGRTYFIKPEDLDELAAKWNEKKSELQAKQTAAAIEEARKKETIIYGFYYIWDSNYSGRYGKKQNFKLLRWYTGSELGQPRNFTPCTPEFYNSHKEIKKSYFGWDEPKISDFN